jgi:hypothetical protein
MWHSSANIEVNGRLKKNLEKIYKTLTVTKTAPVFSHYYPSFWDLESKANDSHVALTPEVRIS